MTNEEAAAHFASLPPGEPAKVLVINGDFGSADPLLLDPPGTNLEDVEEGTLGEGDEKLVTAFTKW